jgi:hypothetical protein
MEKELIILAIYINIEGMPVSQARQSMQQIKNQYDYMYNDTNKDVKVYWFQSNETKVECIYPPMTYNGNNFENELLKIYKLIFSSQPEDVKNMLSNIEKKLKLNKLLNKLK